MFVPGKIRLELQPSNSPDLNILDLGFFRAIQSAYYQEAPGNVGQLITMVEQAYRTYPPTKINHVWLTLQSVFNEIILCGGSNKFKIPHMKKEKLERQGRLPRVLDVVDCASEFITEMDDPEYHDDESLSSLEDEPVADGDSVVSDGSLTSWDASSVDSNELQDLEEEDYQHWKDHGRQQE